MMDFRTVKESVKEAIKGANERDNNWKWRVEVLKSEIRVWWGYLQYMDTEDSHFTIKAKDEDFIGAYTENDSFIDGAFVGDDFYCDGDLSKCVAKLVRVIESRAHRCY